MLLIVNEPRPGPKACCVTEKVNWQTRMPRSDDGGQLTPTGVTAKPVAGVFAVTIGRSFVLPVLRITSWRWVVDRGRMRTVMRSPALNWPFWVSVTVMFPPRQSVEPFAQFGWLAAVTVMLFLNARM